MPKYEVETYMTEVTEHVRFDIIEAESEDEAADFALDMRSGYDISDLWIESVRLIEEDED